MLSAITFTCPHCAQSIESAADPSQGANQSYIEDCQVCCRPLRVEIRIDNHHIAADAFPESD
jgi:transcription elongation factor Elf1